MKHAIPGTGHRFSPVPTKPASKPGRRALPEDKADLEQVLGGTKKGLVAIGPTTAKLKYGLMHGRMNFERVVITCMHFQHVVAEAA